VLKDLKGIASHSVLLRKKIRSKGISQSHWNYYWVRSSRSNLCEKPNKW
jgi:hypothetical protein